MNLHSNRWQFLLLVLVAFFFCLFTLLGMWRHSGYLTSINDLGCFDQVVWMASNGHPLVNTSNFDVPMNWLGFHFQPVLFAFVLLYKITPTVNWFIFAQSGALAIAAWPVFLITERVTASGKTALMWALAYLMNPFMLNTAAWDFHPVSIAVPFLALGLLAVERKQMILLVAVSAILLTCKEHMGLAVAGLGLLYAVRNREWITGISLFVAGIAAFTLIILVVLPSFSLTGQHLMFSDDVGQLSRYSWLGSSPKEVISNILTEPMFVIQRLVAMGGLQYLFQLLVPFLFLPLAGVLWILPATADILINMLSANPMPRSIFSYHSVTVIPVLAVAAIHAGQRLSSTLDGLSSERIATFAMSISLFLGYVLGPFSLPGSRNIWNPVHTISFYDNNVKTVQDIIGNASASIQANIGSHFSQRTLLYRYPRKLGEAEFVVLRLETPSKWGFLLSHHFQMEAEEFLDSVNDSLADRRYGVVYWKDPWLIMQQGQEDNVDTRVILTKIEQLREDWTRLDYK